MARMSRSPSWAPGRVGALALAASLVACRDPGPRQRPRSSEPGAAPSHTDLLSTGKALYSHESEELIVRDFFQDRRNGFFLDVGCGHPIADSNTYYLEKHLGWSGIGLDALPEFARKWRRQRPASRFFNYIATDHAGGVERFYRAEESVKDISSLEKPARSLGGRPVRSEEIRVPAITLTRLLEESGVSKLDFLSMDIEGAEPLALAGFDIERFRPELACIEAKPQSREKILKYFADHGYRRIEAYRRYDEVNYYFTPAGGH